VRDNIANLWNSHGFSAIVQPNVQQVRGLILATDNKRTPNWKSILGDPTTIAVLKSRSEVFDPAWQILGQRYEIDIWPKIRDRHHIVLDSDLIAHFYQVTCNAGLAKVSVAVEILPTI
jgi:hypothetical protein